VSPPPSRPPQPPRARRLATHIWLGVLALFGVLATSVCICLWALVGAERSVSEIRTLAIAERNAVAIGVAAREQYMHETHGALLRDAVHVSHEHHWGAMLRQHVAALRPLVDADAGRRLDDIESHSDELSRIFAMQVLPAATAHDDVKLHQAHDEAEKHVRQMVEASDASVVQLATRTQDAMSFSTRTVRIAAMIAAAVTTLAAIIAIALVLGFVRRIVQPVGALELAANRIGDGDFDADPGPLGIREFETLRRRFREMATSLRERESRMLRAERLAALGSLAAGVAHELNNPLGVIIGYVKLLRKKETTSPFEEELKILDDEAHQCRRIVEDLVAFAREPKLDRRRTDLATLVRELAHKVRSTEELEGRALEILADAAVPAEVDPVRLSQVIRNLIMNAASASGAEDTIHIEVHANDDASVIRVRDRGTGIDPRDLPHVFEPFYSKRPGGTGLGLAVCHGIVRAHGGTIELENTPPGTTATIRLPRTPRLNESAA
jgi:signal transduction histidine kinase